MPRRSRLPCLAAALLLAGAPPALAHDFAAGDLAVAHPYAIETRAPTGAGYLSVTNEGAEPDALVAVEAPFPRVTLHRSEVSEAGIASMSPVDRFEIAPGGTLTLAPGADHIMFEGLDGDPLEVGETIPATLVFERAGRVEVVFNVEPRTSLAGAAAAGAADHEGH